ncbi:MAG: NAD-dependent succinate-semialdehyde dehydrogenase [Candidatus Methylacidiphilales bacterium]
MKNFKSINPFTEEVIGNYAFISNENLNVALGNAAAIFGFWRKTTFADRAKCVLKLSELLKENADELALIASTEMGKLKTEAKAEILKSVRLCEYYATRSADILQSKLSQSETGAMVEIKYEPLGVVLGIFPWNFPYWQVLRSAIPIIMSGNCILIKPAPNVPQSSLALQNLLNQCGFENGVIQTIFASETQIETLINDSRIAATTLTGSEKAGADVASLSAKNIKKSVLELGGSDPFIVMPDADLEQTLNGAMQARFQNNGQSCVSAKRFIIHKSIADDFLNGLIEKIENLVIGDPINENVAIGPLARKDLQELLNSQVNDTLNAGATLLHQTKNIPSKGFFYPPTILGNIPKTARAYTEELFGPVISFYTFTEIEEAIALANATSYGLGASIWSKDIMQAKQIANNIESGMIYINQIVKSDARFPFGGIKKSGFGRELGEFGLREFCNVKTIWV